MTTLLKAQALVGNVVSQEGFADLRYWNSKLQIHNNGVWINADGTESTNWKLTKIPEESGDTMVGTLTFTDGLEMGTQLHMYERGDKPGATPAFTPSNTLFDITEQKENVFEIVFTTTNLTYNASAWWMLAYDGDDRKLIPFDMFTLGTYYIEE